MQGPEPATDLVLLQRTAEGDRGAFTQIVKRHQAGVYRYAKTICASIEEAEDVFQETFVQALRGATSFRGGSARSWLLTIARRSLLRMHRLRAGQPRAMESLDALGVRAGWGDADSVHELARAVENRELIEKAFSNLSELDREVLIACDLEGLKAKEACAMLDIEIGALKSRLHRARLRLAATLRELTEESP